ncbi:H-type small acid-soluble spore protein [Haloplasma contractile]|uniref:Small acid-soluble spore protein H n=1 Tax=Haloplasma contractile SSD-17B TaxID=1033810 RepID=U2FH18_9MOLU|nr:H-type small acid-soluble spore protein [Haloplasma contractile]ERJ12150.1 Small acid-soluble spore protein H [Haloplasma contractile SSD-17B]
MELGRAKEIAASPVMAHVTYNGTQVYIQNVNEADGTCSIYELKNPDARIEVPAQNLLER